MGVAPVAIVLLHHAVEGVFALAFFTDDKVEAKCGQCAFLIVADDGVGAVFVLFVELVLRVISRNKGIKNKARGRS